MFECGLPLNDLTADGDEEASDEFGAAGCERVCCKAGRHAVLFALGVKVITCRFQSKRAQRYIRLQLFYSTLKLVSALNDFNVHA